MFLLGVSDEAFHPSSCPQDLGVPEKVLKIALLFHVSIEEEWD